MDAGFPTFAEPDCLALALGKGVIRLKSTATTSQPLALLVKQFLVMWPNKLVHTWETGLAWGKAYAVALGSHSEGLEEILSMEYWCKCPNTRGLYYPVLSQKTHLWRERGSWRPQLRRPSLAGGVPSCLMSCNSAGLSQSAQRWPGWGISSSRRGKPLPCSFCFRQTHLPESLISARCKDTRRRYELQNKVLSQRKAQSCLLLQSILKHIRETLNCLHTCPEGLQKTRFGCSLTVHNKVSITANNRNQTLKPC